MGRGGGPSGGDPPRAANAPPQSLENSLAIDRATEFAVMRAAGLHGVPARVLRQFGDLLLNLGKLPFPFSLECPVLRQRRELLGSRLLGSVRDSDALMLVVRADEGHDAARELAALEGIFCEPSSAAGLAAVPVAW